MIDWNETRVSELRQYHADKKSASVIAERMGTTRNAVLGKLNRLGLCTARPPRQPKIKKKRATKERHTINRLMLAKLEAEAQTEAVTLPPDQSDYAIPFMQATSNHCRWPLTDPTHDMLICGDKPMDGKPYCKRHCKIAYQPIKPRKVKSWIEFRARAA